MLKDFLREIMVLIGWPQAERCTMSNRRDLGWSQAGSVRPETMALDSSEARKGDQP